VGEGRKISEAGGAPSNLAGSGWSEPLQNPPGPQEGRLREPSLQALLRELAAFNTELCLITTRMPVADIAEHERTSALRRELEQISSDAGARLLRALGVKGDQAELQSASDKFNGHCLALTLLGSYLTDAYNGDIRCRKEVSEHLAHDVRQGAHARKVMESYQTWFGEGPELSVLRLLGLFDRPAGAKALGALLKPPAIPGLTESLTSVSPSEWRAIVARLRRARLLAKIHRIPCNWMPILSCTNTLVNSSIANESRLGRNATGGSIIIMERWAPELPDSFRDMEPLFLAVICACNADLYREALHEVYIPRIQRGKACFAANVLGVRETLLSVLVHFFEQGQWGFTRGDKHGGAQSNSGRSTLHPYAGGTLSNSHTGTSLNRGEDLLRACRVLVSFAQSAFAFVFHTSESVALFVCYREADCDAKDRRTKHARGLPSSKQLSTQ
jgi:hypothetical protein